MLEIHPRNNVRHTYGTSFRSLTARQHKACAMLLRQKGLRNGMLSSAIIVICSYVFLAKVILVMAFFSLSFSARIDDCPNRLNLPPVGSCLVENEFI